MEWKLKRQYKKHPREKYVRIFKEIQSQAIQMHKKVVWLLLVQHLYFMLLLPKYLLEKIDLLLFC